MAAPVNLDSIIARIAPTYPEVRLLSEGGIMRRHSLMLQQYVSIRTPSACGAE